MEQLELMVLLAFIGLIALFVYLVKKDVSGSSSGTPSHPAAESAPKDPISTSPAKTSTPTPSVKPSGSALPKKEEQKYVSIYEYTSVQTVKRCAYCDGENKYGAKVCCICGNDIDS